MIIVCESCKASFLVPASLFTHGPRTVRCARCGNVWLAEPQKKQEQPKNFEETLKKFEETLPPPEPQASPPLPPPLPMEPPKPRGPSVLSKLAKALIYAPWIQIIKWSCLSLATLALSAALIIVLARKPIIEHWPEMQDYYMRLGLIAADLPEKLVLKNIYSERRYMDGAMHLVVTGSIFNQADKTQVVPALLVEAVGPGGQMIQSWHIKPPAATLDPSATVPFFSAIISPEGTIVEVNLSFIEPPHDKP